MQPKMSRLHRVMLIEFLREWLEQDNLGDLQEYRRGHWYRCTIGALMLDIASISKQD